MKYYYERPKTWTISGDICKNDRFKEVFEKFASEKIPGGDYHIIQLRKLMWEL